MTKPLSACMISANLGNYDPDVPWPAQIVPPGVTLEIRRLTDANFPPRPKAMTSRLQVGIPKMFGWQMFPGHDVYIWIDASRGVIPETLSWFLDKLDHWHAAEMVVFKHPHRDTVREEYEFVKAKLAKGSKYLTGRYKDEWLDEQFAAVSGKELPLYASTAFAYRPTPKVQAALTAWWYHKTRYLLHDQLAFPHVLWQAGVVRGVLLADVYRCKYLPFVRKQRGT